MTNLLRANLSRLRRDKVLWGCVVLLLGWAAGMMVVWCRDDLGRGAVRELEHYYFRMAPVLGLFQALFAGLFLHTEYSDGTVRNKLIVGRTRREVYLANFLTILLVSLLFLLSWALGSCVGIAFGGPWKFGLGKLGLYLLLAAAFSAAIAALVTFIGMLDSGRSAAVVTLLLWLGLAVAAIQVDNVLSEPEFVESVRMVVDGVHVPKLEPNPHYVTGALRALYGFLYDLLPTGQASQLQSVSVTHPLRALLCDGALTLGFTLGGLALFRRKDLK